MATPRPEQKTALDFICDQFVNGKDTVVAEMGTGVGKSAIAITLARWLNMSIPLHARFLPGGASSQLQTYVLTSQKVLQDQYCRDFSTYVKDIRSSTNFPCSWAQGQSCGEAIRVKNALAWRGFEVGTCGHGGFGPDSWATPCPYLIAKNDFKTALVGVSNYSYMLSEAVYAGDLKERELVVCDEAHNIENEVRKFATISVKDSFVKELYLKLPVERDGDKRFLEWFEKKYAIAVGRLKEMTMDKIEGAVRAGLITRGIPVHANLGALTKKYELLDKHCCQVNRYLLEKVAMKGNYVVVWNDDRERSVDLKPIVVAPQANELLYSRGRKRLLMSATVLDKRVFCASVGLPGNVPFISIPTPFSHKAFGISVRPVGLMSKKHIDRSMHVMVDEVKKILARHPDEKGVIHSVTYNVTQALSVIHDDRLLVQTGAGDRDSILREHLTSARPTVLVSPGMMEGLDLKDDLGRFQIICKVPFPHLGDKVTRTKMERDKGWYEWCTVRTLVQAVGRCIRNKDDWTKTYILDECFLRLIQENAAMFPSYFNGMEIVDPKRPS